MSFIKLLKAVSIAFLALKMDKSIAACQSGDSNIGSCNNSNWDNLTCLDFELIEGQATRDTTFWMLGEIHAYKERTINCIEKLTDKNTAPHVIYLEGVKAGEVVNCEEKGFKNKKNRTCMGWDDMQAHRELLNLSFAKELFDTHIVQECITKLDLIYKGQNDKNIIKGLVKMKKDYQTLTGTLAEKYHAPMMLKAIETLLNGNKNGASFSELFAQNKKNIPQKTLNQQQLKKVKELNHKRNVVQMKQFAKHPKNKKAYFCNGIHHLIEDKESFDSFDSEYIRKELKKGKDQNPYAVLAMKQ